MAQVKDWGSGRRGDVGSLQVDSTASMRIDPRQPLYEQLARHLELCQVRRRRLGARPPRRRLRGNAARGEVQRGRGALRR